MTVHCGIACMRVRNNALERRPANAYARRRHRLCENRRTTPNKIIHPTKVLSPQRFHNYDMGADIFNHSNLIYWQARAATWPCL